MTYRSPQIESSFKVNDLGKVLYDAVLTLKPRRIVEFGTLHGYSTVAMAMALDELGWGQIDSFDLYDAYKYNHGNIDKVRGNLRIYGLSKYVRLHQGDAFDAELSWADLMFVDLSNDGLLIRRIYEKYDKFCPIIFEGGTQERDEVKWMVEFKKLPIRSSGVPFVVICDRFPGLSIIP